MSRLLAVKRHLVSWALILFHSHRLRFSVVISTDSQTQGTHFAISWQSHFKGCCTEIIGHKIQCLQTFVLRIIHHQFQCPVRHHSHLVTLLIVENHGCLHRLSWAIYASVSHDTERHMSIRAIRVTPVIDFSFPFSQVVLASDGTYIVVCIQFHHAVVARHFLAINVTIFPSFRTLIPVGQIIAPLHFHALQGTTRFIVKHIHMICVAVIICLDNADGAHLEL